MEPQDQQDQKDHQVKMDHQVSMDNPDLLDQLGLQEHQEKKAFVPNIVLLMAVSFSKMVLGDDFQKR
uniref:Ovule protein n=1 Tax=Elaeophora elaphi TaxID=1147741 RepID=A0A0R3RRZ2_9BILA